MSLSQLATDAELSLPTVSRIETGKIYAQIEYLEAFARVLRTSLGEIIRVADELEHGKWKP